MAKDGLLFLSLGFLKAEPETSTWAWGVCVGGEPGREPAGAVVTEEAPVKGLLLGGLQLGPEAPACWGPSEE